MTDEEKLGAIAPVPPRAQDTAAARRTAEGTAGPGSPASHVKAELGDGVIELVGETRVAALLSEPFVQATGAESAWVRGRDYKAGLSADGLLFCSAVGNRAPANVRFQLQNIERGGVALPFESGLPYDTGSALAIDRGAAIEAYSYTMEAVEQTFTFHELPGQGDLVVRMAAQTDLLAAEADGGLLFRSDHAEIRYGSAFVLDARGERTPIEMGFDGEMIELTVPASYLAGASLPITIDPLISTFVLSIGTADDTKPEAAFDVDRGVYFVVFEDVFSVVDRDIYGFEVSGAGAVDAATFGLIEGSSINTLRPRVAFNPFADQFLVVCNGVDPASGTGVIHGVLVDVNGAAPLGWSPGGRFPINDSPGSFNCYGADVGANTFGSSINSYLVTWTRQFTLADTDVHGRIVNANGTFQTDRILIDNSSLYDTQPRVSASIGDPSASGDYYSVVWVRDDAANIDGLGDIFSRRVYFDGTFGGPSPPSTVLVAQGDCYGPVTTSPNTNPLPQTGDRFCVVAYQRYFSNGSQFSIYAAPVTIADQVGVSEGVNLMEDYNYALDQVEVDIATDGDGFMMTYAEEFSGLDFDTYYCAGDVQDGPGVAARVTLSERHVPLGRSVSPERTPSIATRFDGGLYNSGQSDDALIVWDEFGGSAGNVIEGAAVDLSNNLPVFGDRAVGTQYCEAALNSSGTKGWVRAMAPDQSIGTRKTIEAFDVTFNAFGYLIISNQPAFIPNPDGARGNLCMLGAGRYVLDVQQSGTGGTFSTDMNPLSIPQPTGFTSIAAGQTWNFQYWHRDVSLAGTLTSNFTNAVSLTFTP